MLLSTPMLPEIENVLSGLTYINPSSALEYIPKLLERRNELPGLALEKSDERKVLLLKLIKAGVIDTPVKAYRLSVNRRFTCKPMGAAITDALPPLKKL